MAENRSIMARLRKETRPHHSKLESLPYFESLIAHSLPLASYINQLRGLGIVHSVLESEIAGSENSMIRSVWRDDLRKWPLLEKDLAFFKPRMPGDDEAVTAAALEMTEKIRLRKMECPETLLGCLYVFEGSTLGNAMHSKDVSKTFCLSDMNGYRYYASYKNRVTSHWREFSTAMDQSLSDPSLHDGLVNAAHETFDGLETFYNALFPLRETGRPIHITRINPEAGNHPIPDDEREVEAALAASRLAWDEFSFYAQCFGRRGRQFSDSDTCWLATLCRFDQETLDKQVEWLCRYLSGRGMPTVMMEASLKHLYRSLAAVAPEREAAYKKFQTAAKRLKKKREKWIPEKNGAALVDAFEAAVGPKLSMIHKNAGQLLISAVADEQSGAGESIAILTPWYCDTGCFPDRWVKAVENLIHKSRELVQNAPQQ